MACPAGEGWTEFVLSGCRFGKWVLSYVRWPVPSVFEWLRSLDISLGACPGDLARRRARTQVRVPLGREGSRDSREWSGVTASGATNASASSRRASAPGTLRHYLATRLEDVCRQPSAGMSVHDHMSETLQTAAV